MQQSFSRGSGQKNLPVISVPETEPHCSSLVSLKRSETKQVISVPETEPHCSTNMVAGALVRPCVVVISVPETEPHCSRDHFLQIQARAAEGDLRP